VDLRNGVETAENKMNVSKNYFEGFEGKAAGGSKNIPADKIIRLPDQPCRFAVLSNWSTDDTPIMAEKSDAGVPESDLDNMQEIYYGFGGQLIAQLFVGQSSEMFPVSNLNQICIRARPGQSARVYFAWFS
jgi:hypothetical protein